MQRSSSRFPQIPEILSLICECLRSEKSALASLAATSKAFEEPVLDVLWYDLCGFANLVKCLPPQVLQQNENGVLTLTQLLSSADSSRFIYYAKRVKHFTLTHPANEGIDVKMYHALHLALHGEKILPNVRQMTWKCEEDTVHIVCMFLGPHLTDMKLRLSPAMSFLELSLFTALPECSPQLESVSLKYTGRIGIQTHATLDLMWNSIMIHKWKYLRSLEITFLGMSGVLAVSQLPRLERLKIYGCKSTAGPLKVAKRGFPMLNYLHIASCPRASDCIAILKILDGSPLRVLEVGITHVEDSNSWASVILTISQRCCRKSLSEVRLEDKFGKSSTAMTICPQHEAVRFESIEPLMTFPNIELISLRMHKHLYFSDSTQIKKIAAAWTKLRIFVTNVLPYTRCDRPPPITVEDLFHFAERCPHLMWLGIDFDAFSPPMVNRDNVMWRKAHTHPLKIFHVGNSPISDPAKFAATLSGIFPSLTQIITIKDAESTPEDSATGDNRNAWRRVEDLMELFSAVRDHKRSLYV